MTPQLSSQLEAASIRAGIDPASMQMTAAMAPQTPQVPAAAAPMAQPTMMYNVPISAPQPAVAAPNAAPAPAAMAAPQQPPVSAAPAPVMPVPDPNYSAVMAERNRIQGIYSLAGAQQSQLATKLINDGMSIGDAAIALLQDRNTAVSYAPAATPEQNPVSQNASMASFATQLRQPVPVPVTSDEKTSLLATYNNIQDPGERQAFMLAHQTEILAERKLKQGVKVNGN